MSTSAVFDRFGNLYNTTKVLQADGLNVEAYNAYSPVYISATFAMTLLLAFALSTAMMVHTGLHHGPQMWKAVRQVYSEPDDIHMKLMRQYKEVPDWWYLCILVITVVLGIVAIEVSGLASFYHRRQCTNRPMSSSSRFTMSDYPSTGCL
jgi:hypothetical protein